jgi:hypothetical protein
VGGGSRSNKGRQGGHAVRQQGCRAVQLGVDG